jgi:hypothetical protein
MAKAMVATLPMTPMKPNTTQTPCPADLDGDGQRHRASPTSCASVFAAARADGK